MNKFFSILLGASLLAACGTSAPESEHDHNHGSEASANLADGLYAITKVAPKVTWSAEKLTGDGHQGTLAVSSGKFKVANGQIQDGVVNFDMTQIAVTDLTGEEKASLEGHLRSGDFFNVETHPNAVLTVNRIEGNTLSASLDMNGVKVDYSIPVNVSQTDVPGDQQGITVTGKFDLDRTKHNITYHSQTFDDKLDWFIKDDVAVAFAVMGVPVQ